ncbi:hypothetical protein PAPYR_6999 [Paratrimastix pyriformis]|uniref:Uncharacterized protein n=1 Tax=Paratrimastix pyriformis TaxID=342808 RepID=A0ABQ8UGL2_9EUKA|nr:hypothetical protein PAPYR_6999 [Paratrimastix pyriformis]
MPRLAVAAFDGDGLQLFHALSGQLRILDAQLTNLGIPNPDAEDDNWSQLLDIFARTLLHPEMHCSFGVTFSKDGHLAAVALNKMNAEIRAVAPESVSAATWARSHYNASVLCLSSNYTGASAASDILEAFFLTPFGTRARDHYLTNLLSTIRPLPAESLSQSPPVPFPKIHHRREEDVPNNEAGIG